MPEPSQGLVILTTMKLGVGKGRAARFFAAAGRAPTLLFAIFPMMLATLTLACGSGNGAITFISERDGNPEVYVMQPDGSEQLRLSTTEASESRPIRSPNDRWIAFVSQTSDTDSDIIRIQEDGTMQAKIAGSLGLNRQHVWSPDSQRIALVSDRTGELEIWHLSVDGTDERRVTYDAKGVVLGDWSADGASLLFTVDDPPGIVLRNPDGVNVQRLTESEDHSPQWSPKGDQIVFVSTGEDNQQDIFVMNGDGSERKALTQNAGDNYDPKWSPDGKQICYVSSTDGDAEIFVMKADGSGQEQLTKNNVEESSPVWSPGGKRIAFVSYLYMESEIFAMDPDGTNQKRLTNNSVEDHQPNW